MSKPSLRMQMIKHNLKVEGSSGLTLVEIIIGAAIGAILLAVTTKVFLKEKDSFENSNDKTLVRAKGRIATEIITKEFRRIGFNIPSGKQIISIKNKSITYRAASDISTTIPIGEVGTNAAKAGDRFINVVDAEGFSDEANIMIFDPSSGDHEFHIIDGDPDTDATPNSIPLKDPLTKDYVFDVNSKFFRVDQINQITIGLSGNNIERKVGAQTQVIISDMDPAEGLALDYFDSKGKKTINISEVHKISFALNLIDPKNEKANIQFKSDVALRNISS
jgi:hypothetical protein